MGVPYDSEALSTDSGGCTEGDGWALNVGADGFGVLSDGHRDRASGDSRSVIILLFLPAFGVVMVVDVVVFVVGGCFVVMGLWQVSITNCARRRGQVGLIPCAALGKLCSRMSFASGAKHFGS